MQEKTFTNSYYENFVKNYITILHAQNRSVFIQFMNFKK